MSSVTVEENVFHTHLLLKTANHHLLPVVHKSSKGTTQRCDTIDDINKGYFRPKLSPTHSILLIHNLKIRNLSQ